MIRINLASRKQAAGVEGSSHAGPKISADLSILKDPVIRNTILVIIVAIGANWSADELKNERLAASRKVLSRLTTERTRLETEASKIKDYEKLKTDLEADQEVIKTKLEVITKLLEERGTPAQILRLLSTSIPADTWLAEFKIANSAVTVKGYAAEFSQVPDFIKILEESAYFVDVVMTGSKEATDEAGMKVAEFEISAKRK